MKQKFTRHVVRLLMLFVGLFAISNVGWAYPELYLMGVNGNWNTSDPKLQTSNGIIYTATGVNITDGKEFKVADSGFNNQWAQGYWINQNQKYTVPSGGDNAVFKFNNSNSKVIFNRLTTEFIAGSTSNSLDYSGLKVSLSGNHNGWSEQDLTSADGIYKFDNVALGTNEFQIRIKRSDNNYKYFYKATTTLSNGRATSIDEASGNMTISGASSSDKYNVTINLPNATILVEKVAEVTPTTYTFYLDLNDTDWSGPNLYYWDSSNNGQNASMQLVDGYKHLYKVTITTSDLSGMLFNQAAGNWNKKTDDIGGSNIKDGYVYILNSSASDQQKWGYNNNTQYSASYKEANPETSQTLYYYTEDSNGWSAGKEIKVGDSFTLSSANANDNKNFVFGKTSTVSWNASDLYAWGEYRNVSEPKEDYEAYSGGTNTFCMFVANGDYTITVKSFEPGNKVVYSVTKTGGGVVETSDYVLIGDWGDGSPGWPDTESWTNNPQNLEKSGDYYEFKYEPTTTHDFYFRVMTKDGNTQYGPTDTKNNCEINGKDTPYASSNSNPYTSFHFKAMAGWTYYIKFYPVADKDFGGTKYYYPVQIWWEEGAAGNVELKQNKAFANKVYLLGNVINNNYPSPAWEMTGSSTKQLNNFAMRYNNNIGVAVYDTDGNPTYYDFSNDLKNSMPTKEKGGYQISGGYYMQAGWTYSATYTPGSNGGQGTLTLTPSTFDIKKDILPYVGILGQNFVQRNTYTNRQQYQDLMGSTDYGWQEAFIEYGANGAPLFEADGKTPYYNTVWPPKNNILMQAQIKDNSGNVDKLNISSTDLTMTNDDTKTISGWKSTLSGSEYENLRKKFEEIDSNGTKEYTRFVIDGMWMSGPFKIWTGWGGHMIGSGGWGALWDTHVYWSPKSDGDGVLVPGTVFETDYNSNNFVPNTSRAYYKTLELFVPTDSKNGYDFMNSLIYTTQSEGGAQIDAKADANDNVYYKPELVAWPTGDYKVTHYTVTRYQYDPEVSKANYASLPTCDKNNNEVSEANARVLPAYNSTYEESSITNQDLFAAEFEKVTSGDFKDYSNNGKYGEGLYIFRLQVTFTDKDGNEKKADEWSPYVEIINTNYSLGLEAYQLIKLTDTKITSAYTHVAYDPEYDCKVVSLDSDGTVSKMANLNNVSEDLLKEAYELTGEWTNKVLLVSKNPSNFVRQGQSRVSTITVDNKELKALNAADDHSERAAVIDRKNTLASYKFSPVFKGTITGFDEGTTTIDMTNFGDRVQSAEYTPHFMMPAFKNDGSAKLYFDDNQEAQEFTASHDDLNTIDGESTQQEGVKSNRYMLKAQLNLQMPNVSAADGLATAVYEALEVNTKAYKDGENAASAPVYKAQGLVGRDDYSIHYRYQNPYDWMYKGTDEKWYGYARKFDLTQSAYTGKDVDVVGVVPTLDKLQTVYTHQVNPIFNPPVVHSAQNTEYFADIHPDDAAENWIATLYLRKVSLSTNNTPDDFSPKTGNSLKTTFKQDLNENMTYIIKVEDGSDLATRSDITIEPVSSVVKYTWISGYNDGTDEDPEDPQLDAWDHPLLSFSVPITDRSEGAEIDENDNDFKNLETILDNLHIQIAYAYYFSAGTETGDTQSYLNGFTADSQVPAIRYDKVDETQSARLAPRRVEEVEAGTASKELSEGDNAFLFIPLYADIKASNTSFTASGGQLTGVKEVDVDYAASLIVGRGFIDLNGSEGAVYSTDGRLIYHGDSRVNVASGVYVVTYGPQSVKVLVK